MYFQYVAARFKVLCKIFNGMGNLSERILK